MFKYNVETFCWRQTLTRSITFQIIQSFNAVLDFGKIFQNFYWTCRTKEYYFLVEPNSWKSIDLILIMISLWEDPIKIRPSPNSLPMEVYLLPIIKWTTSNHTYKMRRWLLKQLKLKECHNFYQWSRSKYYLIGLNHSLIVKILQNLNKNSDKPVIRNPLLK